MIVESKLEVTSRRNFLQRTTLAAMAVPAAAALSACADVKTQSAPTAPPAPPAAPAKTPRQLSDEMDAMHEAGVKAFPAATEGKGNQLIAAAAGRRSEGLRPDSVGDPMGGGAGKKSQSLGVQRAGARAADPGPRGRPGACRPQE